MPTSKRFYVKRVDRLCENWSQQIAEHFQDSNGKVYKFLKENFTNSKLLEVDFGAETSVFLKQTVLKSNSPIVFSHGDFNRTNIMLTFDNENDVSNQSQNWNSMKLVDFDFSCYNFRGVDLGKFMTICDKSELFSDEDLVSDEKMLKLIDYYIEECCNIHGEQFRLEEINQPQQILNEAKLFSLYFFIVDTCFCVWYALFIKPEEFEGFVVSF